MTKLVFKFMDIKEDMKNLNKVLTKKELEKYPLSSFDVIGDIAIVNIPEELQKKAKKIGKIFLENIPNAKVVVDKFKSVSGKERIQKVKVIAGENRTETIHKENGFKFKLDLNKVYFTPRLNSERLRIANKVKKNEIVYDMFCGVGPFAIQAARKCKLVIANDINKHAIEYLKRNIGMNKIDNLVAYNMDAKNMAKLTKKHGKADRIIMNHPSDSEKYLDIAGKIAKKSAVIHFYAFLEEGEKKKFSGFKVKGIKKCGEYSATIDRVCFDLVAF